MVRLGENSGSTPCADSLIKFSFCAKLVAQKFNPLFCEPFAVSGFDRVGSLFDIEIDVTRVDKIVKNIQEKPIYITYPQLYN